MFCFIYLIYLLNFICKWFYVCLLLFFFNNSFVSIFIRLTFVNKLANLTKFGSGFEKSLLRHIYGFKYIAAVTFRCLLLQRGIVAMVKAAKTGKTSLRTNCMRWKQFQIFKKNISTKCKQIYFSIKGNSHYNLQTFVCVVTCYVHVCLTQIWIFIKSLIHTCTILKTFDRKRHYYRLFISLVHMH